MTSVATSRVQNAKIAPTKSQLAEISATQDKNQRLEGSRIAEFVSIYSDVHSIDEDMTDAELVKENCQLLETIAKNKRDEAAANRKQNTLFKRLQDAVKNFDDHITMKDKLVEDGVRARQRRVLVKSKMTKPALEQSEKDDIPKKKEHHINLTMSIGYRSAISIIKNITKFNEHVVAQIQMIVDEPLVLKQNQLIRKLVREHKKQVIGVKDRTALTLEKSRSLTHNRYSAVPKYDEFVTKFGEAVDLYNKASNKFTIPKIEKMVAKAVKTQQ